jgi:hypothetical protein
MTEDEASRKWCPHGRVHNAQGAYNRTDSTVSSGPSRCVASNCMAWRWVKDPLVAFVANEQTIVDKTSEHGYCGLAGPL